MNATSNNLTLGLILLFFACGQPKDKKPFVTSSIDSTQKNNEKNEPERLERRKQIEAQEVLDSLRLDKILKKALGIGKSNINKTNFSMDFQTIDTVNGDVETNVTIGNLFSKVQKHLLIKRHAVGYIFINVFKINKEDIKPVLYHKQWNIEYVNDTIQDINGDGYFDFVVNTYGSTGCCLKAFSNVYLLQSNRGTFTNGFEFINPTFSPKEKIIRGVCYGHPGETEMYKFKWNGENVDTIEYVYYERNAKGKKTGNIIYSNRRPNDDNVTILKRSRSVAAEYTRIDGYDWFTEKGYE